LTVNNEFTITTSETQSGMRHTLRHDGPQDASDCQPPGRQAFFGWLRAVFDPFFGFGSRAAVSIRMADILGQGSDPPGSGHQYPRATSLLARMARYRAGKLNRSLTPVAVAIFGKAQTG